MRGTLLRGMEARDNARITLGELRDSVSHAEIPHTIMTTEDELKVALDNQGHQCKYSLMSS